MDAPIHYFMGQIEQESRCDAGATAFDGGIGLGQITPETAQWIHEKFGLSAEFGTTPQPYDPRWAIRAMIAYNSWLMERIRQICPNGNIWYFVFRAYNGGLTNLRREIMRAQSCDISKVEKCCSRRVIRLKNSWLDLCKVNIEYPYQVFRRSAKYVL